ncbi:MAG: DUF503 domain-containing protein [Actinomycetota bacterium]|nr:DUF503 domain-containing protein [Actinomycetota bacterium]
MAAGGALVVQLHLHQATSLKAKRAVLRHLLDTARQRYGVAAAEVGEHDRWQLAELAFAAVAAKPAQVSAVLDTVERFVWSHPDYDVISCTRHWLDLEA